MQKDNMSIEPFISNFILPFITKYTMIIPSVRGKKEEIYKIFAER